MKWSWRRLGPVATIAWALGGCGESAAEAASEPDAAAPDARAATSDGATDAPAAPFAEPDELRQLSVVEVTTVTTVQASSGIFLSPRPQQQRPTYVAQGAIASASASPPPSVELDRAKVDTALLFEAPSSRALRFELPLGAIEAQHFFPAVKDGRWPITLGAVPAGAPSDSWTEWDGWRGFGGLPVEAAPAATLDYELLGQMAPLVLSADGEDILVTNRSTQTIAKTLLVYVHAGGIGVRLVDSLAPGMSRITAAGPKEHPPATLLAMAREQLKDFFGEAAGPELARAIAQAKSIPFLETLGLRLIYLLDEDHAPAPIELPHGVVMRRRLVVAQAEVLVAKEEAHVISLLHAGGLRAADVPLELGRFSRAKLEVAAIRDESVKAQANQLLLELME